MPLLIAAEQDVRVWHQYDNSIMIRQPYFPKSLSFPNVLEYDWDADVSSTEGTEQFVIVTQARGANLLKNLSDDSFTIERFAWLTLWHKGYLLIDAVRTNLAGHSEFVLEILSRSAFDLLLHGMSIIEKESEKRLHAYVAWNLWNDIAYQKEIVNPKTLDGIWDSTPAMEIYQDTRGREQFENIYGPLDISIDDKELRKGRFKQQNKERHLLHNLEVWLSSPELAEWKDRIENIYRKNKGPITFFSLFNESSRSVPKHLLTKDMRFIYFQYLKGSMYSHLSTIDKMMEQGKDKIVPRSFNDYEDCEELAKVIANMCTSIFYFLHFLKGRLWKNKSIP